MPDDWDYSKTPRTAKPGVPTPILTFAFMGICCLITLANFTSSQPGGLWYAIGHSASLRPDEIWDGHYGALFTSVFQHGDELHLLFNMLWLFALGTLLENTIHPLLYVLFFIASGVIGSGAELAEVHTGIGVSGIVYAMFGLMWVGVAKYPHWRRVANASNLKLFVGWGIFCVIATQLHIMNVGNAAHGAGFLFGLAVGWIAFAPRYRPIGVVVVAALVALTVMSATWMPWNPEWLFWKAGRDFDANRYARAIEVYKESMRRGEEPKACEVNISRAWHNLAIDYRKRHDDARAALAYKASYDAAVRSGDEKEIKDTTPVDLAPDSNDGVGK